MAPSERRLTSTGRHPRPGVGLPKRLMARRMRDIAEETLGKMPDASLHANVRKVETCSIGEYDSGRGLRTVFEMGSSKEEKSRCQFFCNGGTQGLTMSLRVTDRSPLPTILHDFLLPDPANKIGIRLYDASVSMEIREQPKQPKERKSKRRAPLENGNCWVIHLDVALKPESVLVQSKAMLRRVESTTKAMPYDWFSYRNYFAKHQPGTQTTSNVEFGDALKHSFVGGYTWRFTGHLASNTFRNALGWEAVDQVEKKANEMGPGQVTTRQSQTVKTAKGKKAAKRAPAKARRAQRVQTRSMALVEESEEEEEQSPEEEIVMASEPEEAEQEWEIEGLLERKTTRGKTLYKVQWSGDWDPTWEPAENVSADAIAEFEKNGAPKKARQKQVKAPAKKPAKRKRHASK